MMITLLMDNPKSWFFPHAKALEHALCQRGHDALLVHSTNAVRQGELAFFLSCEKIIKKDIRDRNKHNLVVHSSPLPQGKGWSPLTWMILEGKNELVNTLFEAADEVDAGDIYLQNTMHFEGHELLDELHEMQGTAINELILLFVDQYPQVTGIPQQGEESFYPKRSAADSELDPEKSIADQFDLLRVVDNEIYPAFFRLNGYTYILKIAKDKNQ